MSTTTAPVPAAPAASAKPAPKRASKLRAVAADPTPKPRRLQALLFAPPKQGKSYFASGIPACYYVDCERGAVLPQYQARIQAGGGAYLGREQGAGDPEVVLEQLRELASGEHDFSAVVIDSVSKLFLDLQADASEKLGDKDQFGASKKPAIAAMRRIAAWVQRLPLNVLLLAHAKPDYRDNQQVGLLPEVWDKLVHEMDLVMRAEKRGTSYVAVVTHSRFEQLPAGTTLPLDFSSIAKAFGAEGVYAARERIVLATPEQVGEIVRLLQATKTPEEEAAKWLKKAGAADWADVDADTAVKIVAYLTEREGKQRPPL